MTKRLFSVLVGTVVISAVTPLPGHAGDILINHQGRLTDAAGNAAADSTYSVILRIFAEEAGGIPLYSESRSVTTTDGLFAVAIGAVTSLSTDVFTCTPKTDTLCPRYLEIEVSPDPPLTPRVRLTAGPFASVAQRLQGDVETDPDAIHFSNNRTIKAESISPAARGAGPAAIEVLTIDGGGLHVDENDDGTPELTVDEGGVSIDGDSDGMADVWWGLGQATHNTQLNIDTDNDGSVEYLLGPDGPIFDTDDDGTPDYSLRTSGAEFRKPTQWDFDGDGIPYCQHTQSGSSFDFNDDGVWDFSMGSSGFQVGVPVSVDPDNDGISNWGVDDDFVVAQKDAIVDPNADGQPELQVGTDNTYVGNTLLVDADGDASNDVEVLGSQLGMRVSVPLEVQNDVTMGTDVNSSIDFVGSATVTGEAQINGGFGVDADGNGTKDLFVLPDQHITEFGEGPGSLVNIKGDATVSGDLDVAGTKSFVQNHPTDPSKEIVYVSLEGGEAGTYTRGSAQLVNGVATVTLPEHFALVTAADGLTVQITPTAPVHSMLYVAEKSARSIVVKSSHPNDDKATFDFLVQGIRAGYEDHQVIRTRRTLSMQ